MLKRLPALRALAAALLMPALLGWPLYSAWTAHWSLSLSPDPPRDSALGPAIRGEAPAEHRLPEGDSLWQGRISMHPGVIRLHFTNLDGMWLIRMRLGSRWIYPREVRVDDLAIGGGKIAFTCSGLRFSGILLGDSISGNWEMAAFPRYRGWWEVRRR